MPGAGDQPYSTSLETDGLTWSAYIGGAQKFGNGPLAMAFDEGSRTLTVTRGEVCLRADFRVGSVALERRGRRLDWE